MSPPKILVVDDEPRMRELIRIHLQPHFTVVEAEDGLSALKQVNLADPDLVLLDVMMPRLDGWATLKRIREESDVPVILLTARGEVAERVQGLHLGADDYLPKPFDGRELVARIQAVLRRTGGAEEHSAIKRGDLIVNVTERTAQWKREALTLTPKEFDLLVFLASNPGQAFTRDRLLAKVWGMDYEGENRTVDSHVKNLREKLGDGAVMIATVWGVGYRFAEVTNAHS